MSRATSANRTTSSSRALSQVSRWVLLADLGVICSLALLVALAGALHSRSLLPPWPVLLVPLVPLLLAVLLLVVAVRADRTRSFGRRN